MAGRKRQRESDSEGEGEGSRRRERRLFLPSAFFEEPLMSYGAFCRRARPPPDRARDDYSRYTAAHELHGDQALGRRFGEEEWFREKYHPDAARARTDRLRREARLKLSLLQTHSDLAALWATPPPSDCRPTFLLSPRVPVHVSAPSLLAYLVSLGSLPLHVILSDVFAYEGEVYRKAWAVYRTEEERDRAREILSRSGDRDAVMAALTWLVDDDNLPTVKEPASVCPPAAATHDRMAVDLRQALALIEKLDGDRGLDQVGVVPPRVEGVEGQLDAALGYLRFVHTFCYYCVAQYESDAALVKECGLSHTRPLEESADVDCDGWKAGVDNRVAKAMEDKGSEGEGGAEEAERRFLELYTTHEGEGKCRCQATDDCKKLFRSAEYLHKHLRIKHNDMMEAFAEDHKRTLAIEAFRLDPHKLRLEPRASASGLPPSPLRSHPPPPQPYRPPPPHVPLPLQTGRGRFPFYPPNAKAIPLFHPTKPYLPPIRNPYEATPPPLRPFTDKRVPVDYSDLY